MTLKSNMRHICRFAAKPDVKQLPDSAVTKAFGNRASGKCVHLLRSAELRSAELAVRRQALLAAEQLLAQTATYVQCMTAEMPAALTDLLKVRLCAMHCLSTCNTELLTRAATTVLLPVPAMDFVTPSSQSIFSAPLSNRDFPAAASICRCFSLAASLFAGVLYRSRALHFTALMLQSRALVAAMPAPAGA